MRTAFAHPIQRLVELGTAGYPLRTRRRLKILNAFAALIAVSSAGYALSYTLTDAQTYRWIIAINLTLVVMALCVPLLHRVNDILGGLVIAGTEGAALFALVALLAIPKLDGDRVAQQIAQGPLAVARALENGGLATAEEGLQLAVRGPGEREDAARLAARERVGGDGRGLFAAERREEQDLWRRAPFAERPMERVVGDAKQNDETRLGHSAIVLVATGTKEKAPSFDGALFIRVRSAA